MSEKTGRQSTGSTDDSGEFFSVGVPLHAVRPGYVRRSADDTLFETLVSGGYAHVILQPGCKITESRLQSLISRRSANETVAPMPVGGTTALHTACCVSFDLR